MADARILETGHFSGTLEQVADRAGISKALIYEYCRGREALLEAILACGFEALSGRALDSIASRVTSH